jgi:hypothetical protein
MAVLLRGTDVRLGIVTNGEHWTLVDAPPNATTGFATWRSDLWLEEPITLRAFRTLLGPRRLFGVPEPERLEALLAASAERQKEVTDQLGRQVRRAVEILVHALDRADRESGRTLLEGVSERELYDAAVTFMMRLVFLFCAEEQGLFPLDDEQYAGNYAASTLFGQLNDAAEQGGEEVLERRTDAWQRLLATFRAIHGGVDHEGMALPPYGGHLFDPDRFPFLEGRPREGRWRATPARPLPITNRTVLHLLSALQLLRDAKTGEAQRLSFRALDIEQIGHVYEGLLDHTVKKAASPMVSLKGKEAEEPEVTVDRLEELLAKGPEPLVKEVAELSDRSAKAVAKDLAAGLAPQDEHPLAVACENDAALAARVRPFTGLVRRDAAGLPVVIPAGSHFVTAGSDRRSTGTHYTPRSLTEPIVRYTLEPLVWEGPAEGKPETEWSLRSAKEILALKVCDMACGSGAFLVEACRYLSKRLVEAWAEVEKANPGKVLITPEGAMSDGRLAESIIPREDEERLALARRLVVDRCLYGVDINPMAVEMAKLSLWLVTLQKNVAFTFLDHCIRCGDSLLGVTDLRQIETLSMDPSRATAPLFLEEACRNAVARAREAREKLEGFTVKDVKDAEAKESMLKEAEQAVEALRLLADVTAALAVGDIDPGHSGLEILHLAATAAAKASGEAHLPVLERLRHLAQSVLNSGGTPEQKKHRPMHWSIEFPEAAFSGGFSAVVGNPPFVGGQKITSQLGTSYRDYLVEYLAAGKRGSADLCAYFFLRARDLLRKSGHFGLLATNTIAQGDTREVGLEQLEATGVSIFRAVSSRKWPGEAALEVAHVWATRARWNGHFILDDMPVANITSYLASSSAVSREKYALAENAKKAFKGPELNGLGFMISPSEAVALICADAKNDEVLQPFFNGEDLVSSPVVEASRWAINFRDWPEAQARTYPLCFDHLRREVLPFRAKSKVPKLREYWWRFKRLGLDLQVATSSMKRVMVCPMIAKHSVFQFVPTSAICGHTTIVFAFDDYGHFALLQSGIHETWVLEFMSTFESRKIYVIEDCFEAFPFPDGVDGLARLGEQYYLARVKLMTEYAKGLTDLYNSFHSESETQESIIELRHLQARMDRACADAYGWTDLDLGHGFRETKQGPHFTISEPARREVLDRLLELNHQRYAEEVAQGLHDKSAKGAKARKASRKTASTDTTEALFAPDEEE